MLRFVVDPQASERLIANIVSLGFGEKICRSRPRLNARLGGFRSM